MTANRIQIVRGGNAPVGLSGSASIRLEWVQSPGDLDISCFMVDAGGKVPSDDYMIFYNQPSDPEGSLCFQGTEERSALFTVDLGAIPTTVDKCVFTATLEGDNRFRDVRELSLHAEGSGTAVVYEVELLAEEKALVLAELYRHSSGWKIRAVGRGFNGGLAPLAKAHGVEVEEEGETSAAGEMAEVEVASRSLQPDAAPAPTAVPDPIQLTKIDLMKKKVAISLEKKNIAHVKARVAVVLDASGSMYAYYINGTVQRSFERALAVAAHMDDDGMMDVWFFGSKSKRMPSVSERDFEDYVKRTYPAPKVFGGVGAGNEEPIVMKDIIKKYTIEEPRKDIPTYILFFSDGGIYRDKEIEALLKKASHFNLFWQFIGIGSSNYGVLKKLDDMRGRLIDNADFFAFDDMERITDEQLYGRLFNEFPQWLKAARDHRLLQ